MRLILQAISRPDRGSERGGSEHIQVRRNQVSWEEKKRKLFLYGAFLDSEDE